MAGFFMYLMNNSGNAPTYPGFPMGTATGGSRAEIPAARRCSGWISSSRSLAEDCLPANLSAHTGEGAQTIRDAFNKVLTSLKSGPTLRSVDQAGRPKGELGRQNSRIVANALAVLRPVGVDLEDHTVSAMKTVAGHRDKKRHLPPADLVKNVAKVTQNSLKVAREKTDSLDTPACGGAITGITLIEYAAGIKASLNKLKSINTQNQEIRDRAQEMRACLEESLVLVERRDALLRVSQRGSGTGAASEATQSDVEVTNARLRTLSARIQSISSHSDVADWASNQNEVLFNELKVLRYCTISASIALGIAASVAIPGVPPTVFMGASGGAAVFGGGLATTLDALSLKATVREATHSQGFRKGLRMALRHYDQQIRHQQLNPAKTAPQRQLQRTELLQKDRQLAAALLERQSSLPKQGINILSKVATTIAYGVGAVAATAAVIGLFGVTGAAAVATLISPFGWGLAAAGALLALGLYVHRVYSDSAQKQQLEKMISETVGQSGEQLHNSLSEDAKRSVPKAHEGLTRRLSQVDRLAQASSDVMVNKVLFNLIDDFGDLMTDPDISVIQVGDGSLKPRLNNPVAEMSALERTYDSSRTVDFLHAVLRDLEEDELADKVISVVEAARAGQIERSREIVRTILNLG